MAGGWALALVILGAIVVAQLISLFMAAREPSQVLGWKKWAAENYAGWRQSNLRLRFLGGSVSQAVRLTGVGASDREEVLKQVLQALLAGLVKVYSASCSRSGDDVYRAGLLDCRGALPTVAGAYNYSQEDLDDLSARARAGLRGPRTEGTEPGLRGPVGASPGWPEVLCLPVALGGEPFGMLVVEGQGRCALATEDRDLAGHVASMIELCLELAQRQAM